MRVFDPGMPAEVIQAQLDADFDAQRCTRTAQFNRTRIAHLFTPGTYRVHANVGYYTSIAGLGRNPGDVLIDGGVNVDAFNESDEGSALQNFWRSAENMTVAPPDGRTRWAVSQGSPFRRMDVRGELVLHPAGYGYASGGYLADTRVYGRVVSASQQQWYTRDSTLGGGWEGAVWNMVFSGTKGAPPTTFPVPAVTSLATTPLSRDVPYLYVDQDGGYRVFLPSVRTEAAGPSWAGGSTPGESLPLSRFHVARPSEDAATINAALAGGRHLLLTPGVYHLDETIEVPNPGTVVLGIGYPTLVPEGGLTAMRVGDVDGVRIKGVLFDAGTTRSPSLLTVGTPDGGGNRADNPTSLHDVFFRIGGDLAGTAATSLVVHRDHTILDHVWAWRADHGNEGTVGWEVNTADTGVEVTGDGVLATGLFVEHYQKTQVVWTGEAGRTIFFQNEMPYDVPDTASWRSSPDRAGYPAYQVGADVTTHQALGMTSYCFFDDNPTVTSHHAFGVPDAEGVRLHCLGTVSLNERGSITHVVNDTGDATPPGTTPSHVVSYPQAHE